MKQLFCIITFLACLSGASAQIKTDAKGNYFVTMSHKDTSKGGTLTGKTFTDAKGKVWPVLISKNGKLFYRRPSAAGTVYNSYLKIN